ncbi:hypothetical protein Y032_0111g233 [Ancylostoma ceylanicum]|nr:hypothetical protein Y032_0111g233 [Ancylostoma ceylanicum]
MGTKTLVIILATCGIAAAKSCESYSSITKGNIEKSQFVAQVEATGDNTVDYKSKYFKLYKPSTFPKDAISLPTTIKIRKPEGDCDSLELVSGDRYIVGCKIAGKCLFVRPFFNVTTREESELLFSTTDTRPRPPPMLPY